jgi:uncharacterized membrane protein
LIWQALKLNKSELQQLGNFHNQGAYKMQNAKVYVMQRSLIAIFVSLAGIMILLKINYNIAEIWAMSGEKTRALFSMVEFGFLYKYSVAAFGLTALVLSFQAYRKNEEKKWVLISSAFSCFAFVATFVKLWKIIVWLN